ncbi:hypothetical protein ADUPG1_006785, partial [Aduncisulcus paluster]
ECRPSAFTYKGVSVYEEEQSRKQGKPFAVSGSTTSTMGTSDDHSALLARIRRDFYKLNISPVPIFRSFDPLRSGHVSRLQFQRVLSMCKVLCVTDELYLNKMTDHFTSRTGRHKGMVDYVMFTNEVLKGDPALKQASGADREETVGTMIEGDDHFASATQVTRSRGIDQILSRISYIIGEKRINLQPFFMQFDSRRTGKVPLPKFSAVFSSAGMTTDLSDEAHELLTTHYAVQETSDGGYVRPEGRLVNYRQFLVDLNVHRTKATVLSDTLDQRMATHAVHPQASMSAGFKGTAPIFPQTTTEAVIQAVTQGEGEESKETRHVSARACVEEILPYFKGASMTIAQFFHGYDRLKRGSVSHSQFKRALVSAVPTIPIPLLDKCCTVFAGRMDPFVVDYVYFLKTCEEFHAVF